MNKYFNQNAYVYFNSQLRSFINNNILVDCNK